MTSRDSDIDSTSTRGSNHSSAYLNLYEPWEYHHSSTSDLDSRPCYQDDSEDDDLYGYTSGRNLPSRSRNLLARINATSDLTQHHRRSSDTTSDLETGSRQRDRDRRHDLTSISESHGRRRRPVIRGNPNRRTADGISDLESRGTSHSNTSVSTVQPSRAQRRRSSLAEAAFTVGAGALLHNLSSNNRRRDRRRSQINDDHHSSRYEQDEPRRRRSGTLSNDRNDQRPRTRRVSHVSNASDEDEDEAYARHRERERRHYQRQDQSNQRLDRHEWRHDVFHRRRRSRDDDPLF